MSELRSFVNRLKKIGIDVKLSANYPWIYIAEINHRLVVEKFQAEHGFTVAFQRSDGVYFTDLGRIFKLIRKYL